MSVYLGSANSGGVLCVLVDVVGFVLCRIWTYMCVVCWGGGGVCVCFFLPSAAVIVVYSIGLWVCDVLFPLFPCVLFILVAWSRIWIFVVVRCVLEYCYCELYSYLVMRCVMPVWVIMWNWYYVCLCQRFWYSGVLPSHGCVLWFVCQWLVYWLYMTSNIGFLRLNSTSFICLFCWCVLDVIFF
jgi:hypothetical protein